jgi:acyl carrier protein
MRSSRSGDSDEVERALFRASAAIAEAAVVVREDRPEDGVLTAYLVSRGPRRPRAPELRRILATTLPDYMVPSAYVWLDRLPLLPTGKVDRGALPAPGPADSGSPYAAPRTPVEDRVCRIWADVLGVERIGVHDDFFAAGGDSMSAMRVLMRIREAFRIDLSPRTLFETSSVATLAEAILRQQDTDRRPD